MNSAFVATSFLITEEVRMAREVYMNMKYIMKKMFFFFVAIVVAIVVVYIFFPRPVYEAHAPYLFANKNGEIVVFVPILNDRSEQAIVGAFIINGYKQVLVLPDNVMPDIRCFVRSVQGSFNPTVECVTSYLYKTTPVKEVYDSTLRSSWGIVEFVDYGALPRVVDDMRQLLREKVV